MINIDVPGFGPVELSYAVFDYNGTLACDGKIDNDVIGLLQTLQKKLEVHILTADTFGLVKKALMNQTFHIQILNQSAEAEQKSEYVKKLDSEKVISFGNGNNDVGMLKISRIGIAVIKEEGCSTKACSAADLVVKEIEDGMDLLLNPMRLKAGLRY